MNSTTNQASAPQPLPFDKAETISIHLNALEEWIRIMRHVGSSANRIEPPTLLYLAQPMDDTVDALRTELAPLLGAHTKAA